VFPACAPAAAQAFSLVTHVPHRLAADRDAEPAQPGVKTLPEFDLPVVRAQRLGRRCRAP
jgi:hypothetical protein